MNVLIVLLLSIISITAFAQSDKKLADSITKKYKYVYPTEMNGYYFIRSKKEKTGMIDSLGKVIIKPSFEYIFHFKAGRAEAGNLFNNKMKRGLINFNGNIVIPFMYDYILRYNNMNCIVEIGNKYGVVNKDNKIIIPIKYEEVTNANEDILIVKENNRYGFVGEDGKAITKNKYKDVERFYEMKATVILEENSGTVINTEGKELFKPIKNVHFESEKNSFLTAKNIITKKIGVYDTNGKLIIPTIYDDIEFVDENFIVKMKNKFGVIDKENKIKIPFEYDYIYSPIKNQFECNKGKFYGVININNETIIPLKYTKLQLEESKYYFVQTKDTLNSVLDLNGKIIIPESYRFYNYCNNKIFASKNNSFYIFDLENAENKISLDIDGMKEKYLNWSYSHGCIQIAMKNNKYGIVDIDNNIVIPFEYDDVQKLYFESNFIVKMNGKYGIINKENKIIRPIIYDRIIQQKEVIYFYKDGKRVIPTLQ